MTVAQDLADRGFAIVPTLSASQCADLAATWDQPVFRKRVVMERHQLGRGEYRYYADPLPSAVAALREAFWPQLVPIAEAWAADLGLGPIPTTLGALADAAAATGQREPTSLLLRYGPGDYNRLHQDVYGATWFPLQVLVLLSAPGRDFDGGELVLVEQRPRAQSRPLVVPLQQGDAAVFPVHQQPKPGTRGVHRVTFRHGVSEIRRGQRLALGLSFQHGPG